MTGGQWWADTDRFRSNQFTQFLAEAFSANNVSDGVSDILLSSKFLWRQGVIRCPEYCSDDTPQENCESLRVEVKSISQIHAQDAADLIDGPSFR